MNAHVISCNLNEDKETLKIFKISVVHGLGGTFGMKSKACKRISRKFSEAYPPAVKVPSEEFKTKIPQEIRLEQCDHLPSRIANHRRCNYCSTEKNSVTQFGSVHFAKSHYATTKMGGFTKFQCWKLKLENTRQAYLELCLF